MSLLHFHEIFFSFTGTGYEVQLFASTSPDELPKRRKMVQMSLRLFEKIPKEIGPSPNVVVVKNYVLSDKPLTISAKLDKGNYTQGEEIQLTLKFHRKDKQPHGIRKVKVTLFQQVSFFIKLFTYQIGIPKEFCNHLLIIKQDVIGILWNTCQKKQMAMDFFCSSWRALIRIIFYPTNLWLFPSNCIRWGNTADLEISQKR